MKEITVVVHSFKMGDVEDPDLYASEPLYKWEHSEAGKWVMENAIETPVWQRGADNYSYGYDYKVIAKFTPEQYTYYKLKYE